MATAATGIIINSLSGRLGNVVYLHKAAYRQQYDGEVRARACHPAQSGYRSLEKSARTFSDAVRSWQAMPAEERYAFNRRARYMNMSGYNFYISQYMKSSISDKSATSEACPPRNVALYPVFFNRFRSSSIIPGFRY